jgi:hypothetical protein
MTSDPLQVLLSALEAEGNDRWPGAATLAWLWARCDGTVTPEKVRDITAYEAAVDMWQMEHIALGPELFHDMPATVVALRAYLAVARLQRGA